MKKIAIILLSTLMFAMKPLFAMRHDPYKTPKFRRMVARIKKENATPALKTLLDSPIWGEYNHHTENQIKDLIKDGADPNCANQQGNTALMYASEFALLNLADLLLRNGADLNHTNFIKQNALISGIIALGTRGASSYSILKLLIKRNININHRDSSGHDALRYAFQYGHPDAANLLVDAGVDLEEKINDKNAYEFSAAIEKLNVQRRVGPKRVQSAFFRSIGSKSRIP